MVSTSCRIPETYNYPMKKYMKSGFVMIAAVLFMLQAAETRAAILKYVRTAKHPDFTRIAFEFQKPAQFKEPVIDGEGKFTVVFPGSTTVLPRQILYNKTRIQTVRSIEFVQKGALLTAGITLSFPYFKLKTFSLSGPDRVVIDAYTITQTPRKNLPEESLHVKPSEEESKAPETKEPKAMSEKSSEEELTGFVTQQPTLIPEKSPEKEIGDTLEIKKTDASDITLKRAKEISVESVKKVPASPINAQSVSGKTAKQEQIKPDESRPSMGNNYNLQTYMLALLNFLTIVIILLLSINLIKRKSGIHSEHSRKISESLRTVDESISAIDAMINRELKKHDES